MRKLRKSELEKFYSMLSESQAFSIKSGMRGEEKEFFSAKAAEMYKSIQSCPDLYEQDGKGGAATVYMHYFKGGSDWLITEYDGKDTCFGYACVNGDIRNAEFGYVNIEELRHIGAELDLHFTPKPMCIARGELEGKKPVEVAFDAVRDDDGKSLRVCLDYGVGMDEVCEAYGESTLGQCIEGRGGARCKRVAREFTASESARPGM